MSNLGPQKQNASYAGLLQVPGGITSTLQTVTDGDGNATGLSLSTTAVSALGLVSSTSQNIYGGTAGSIVYQSAVSATSFVSPGTTGQLLSTNGVLAPTFVTVDANYVDAVATSGDAMTGNLSMSGNMVTNLGTPTASTDAASKAYVDSVAAGLQIKAPVTCATTTNLASLSGLLTIDGVTLLANQRVLVKDQFVSELNGIYSAAVGAWSRTSDADTWSELVGAAVFVSSGSLNASTTWVCNVSAGGTLGATPVTFVQFGSSGTYTAGSGLTLVGNQFSITAPVSVSLGGTGVTSLTGIPYGNNTSAFTAATGSQIVGEIGSTAVSRATNLANGGANRLPVQLAADTTGFLPTGSAGQVLTSNGAGSLPSFTTPSAIISNYSNVAFTGAISRPIASILGDRVSVLDFGADPTGATNSNAAFQAAFNTGRLVYVPAGNYTLSSGVTTSGPGMVGDGQRGTYIYVDNAFTSGDVIRWNGTPTPGTHGPMFADFTIECFNGIRTSGALINITPDPDTPSIDYAYISNIHLSNGYIGLKLKHAWYFKVIGCNFTGASFAGVHVSSPGNSDGGDSAISSCHFGNAFCCIYQESSGGLKITNSKLLGGTYGYWLNAVLPNKNMADLLISNCSIESFSVAGIALNRDPSSGPYGISGIVISGNQMGTMGPGESTGSWCIICNDSDNFIVDLTITGNTFLTFEGNNCIGLDYQNYLYVGANQFQAATPTSTGGLLIGANVQNCVADGNQYQSFAAGNGLQCTSTSAKGSDFYQRGSITIAQTSTPYGGGFYTSGFQTITFSSAFPSVPFISVTANAGTGSSYTGGALTFITNNITTTGFQIGTIGINPSGSSIALWEAKLDVERS